MAKAITTVTIATELATIQAQKAIIEGREKELKDMLLNALKGQGVSHIRLEDGTTFTRSHRETLKIKDEAKAMKWAEENNCLKIDTTKSMKILRRELKMPRFFTRVVGEDYLTIKRVGGNDEE